MSDVQHKIASGAYENKVPYDVEKIPVDENRMTVAEAKEHIENEKARSRNQRRLHADEDGRIIDRFKKDLEEEHGFLSHPKAGALWSIAWDAGHSGGLNEVANEYERLAELLK